MCPETPCLRPRQTAVTSHIPPINLPIAIRLYCKLAASLIGVVLVVLRSVELVDRRANNFHGFALSKLYHAEYRTAMKIALAHKRLDLRGGTERVFFQTAIDYVIAGTRCIFSAKNSACRCRQEFPSIGSGISCREPRGY